MGYSRLEQVTKSLQWVTAGYSRECLQWVTAGYCRLPNDYNGLQPVTAGYRVVTVGCSRLPQQVTTAGYPVVTVGYSRLQQVTEWLQ